FGQARPANWPQNLDADPHATAQIDDRARPYTARPATAEEVERLWPRFLTIWPAHQSYLDRSGVRRMFVLEPAKTRDVSPGFPGSARLGYPAAPAESLASLRAVALSGPV